jgi:hypothetical protein
MPVLDVEGMSLIKLVHGSVTASLGIFCTFLLLEHLEFAVALDKVVKELRELTNPRGALGEEVKQFKKGDLFAKWLDENEITISPFAERETWDAITPV